MPVKPEVQKHKKQEKNRFGAFLPVLGIVGVMFWAPQNAGANNKSSFLETIGISMAVGTVLGASTLPFYDQPGKHLRNPGWGAASGVAVGLGVVLYEWIKGPSGDLQAAAVRQPSQRFDSDSASFDPSQIWMPVVSLTF